QRGRVYAGNNVLTYALQKADGYLLTPNIYNSDYVNVLINYCKEHEIQVVISLFDIDLPVLAKNKFVFDKENITLLVSDYSFVQLCNDKWLSYRFIVENGLNSPKTFISLQDVKKA